MAIKYIRINQRQKGNLHLFGAFMVVLAIVLVNDNGVLHIGHDGMLEINTSHKTFARAPPCLNPQTILCVSGCQTYTKYSTKLKKGFYDICC